VTAERGGDVVPVGAAVRAWFAISLQTFGGPAGQIAVMQRALVDEHRWIGQRQFLHALSYCMLLPGPEADQLAIYVGWLLNGLRGGLVAGVLFVLPGMVALLALSALYVGFGDTTAVAALSAGLGATVVAVVAQAVVRVGPRALHHPVLIGLAVAAFVALAVFGLPFPIVIVVAALLGWLASRRIPALTKSGDHGTSTERTEKSVRPSGRSSVTSTSVTCARGDPCRTHSIMAPTAVSSPSKTASTDPSSRFVTHPAT
jgi:chromate transporter